MKTAEGIADWGIKTYKVDTSEDYSTWNEVDVGICFDSADNLSRSDFDSADNFFSLRTESDKSAESKRLSSTQRRVSTELKLRTRLTKLLESYRERVSMLNFAAMKFTARMIYDF